MEETLRDDDKVSISRHSSRSSRYDDPMENDDILNKILIYAPKEEDKISMEYWVATNYKTM